MSLSLATQRLKFRELPESDLGDLVELVTDEEQMRFYPRRKTQADQGLATEAAIAAPDAATDRFSIPRVVALIHPNPSHPAASPRSSGCTSSEPPRSKTTTPH